jgi:hypothetical protein
MPIVLAIPISFHAIAVLFGTGFGLFIVLGLILVLVGLVGAVLLGLVGFLRTLGEILGFRNAPLEPWEIKARETMIKRVDDRVLTAAPANLPPRPAGSRIAPATRGYRYGQPAPEAPKASQARPLTAPRS